MMATKRTISTATRVAGDNEGIGKGSKGDGDSNKGVGQQTATVTKRAMATVTRVVGDKEGNGNSD